MEWGQGCSEKGAIDGTDALFGDFGANSRRCSSVLFLFFFFSPLLNISEQTL